MTVWEDRDLPVLRALAMSDDPGLREGFLPVGESVDDVLGVGFPAGQVHDAILTLQDAGYVEADLSYNGGPTAIFTHFQVTGRGLQALGWWPLFDEIASPESLALLLERLAEEASPPETSSLKRAALYVRSVGVPTLRTFAVGAVTQLAKTHLGLG